MNFQLRSKQDIIDFTNGCCFFGTGGGGDPKFGQQLLQEVIQTGKTIDIIDSHELSPDALTACPFLMGSSGPENVRLQKTFGLNKKNILNMPLEAIKLLQKYTGVSIDALVPMEIGGASTASAAATAGMLGIPLIDADYAGGRALPEISQMLPALQGLSYCPLTSVDAFGNQVIIQKATNSQMEERLGKLVASASFGLAGQAGLLLPLKRVQSCIQKGTLSRAFCLGKAIRQAAEAGNPMIPNICEHAHATFLMQGRVTETKAYEKDHYYIGEQVIEGNGDHVKIWFKNEYLQLWKNDEPLILSPDLICVVNYPSGQPLLNSQIKQDDTVAIFAIHFPPSLITANTLQKLCPRYFDFAFDYKPF